jgi:FtsP/CotA-like multicopper oxidase with cupredoxin domain
LSTGSRQPIPARSSIARFVIGGSSEPSGRGLAGILVVEEAEPLVVDLDLPVLVSDWLLGDDHVVQPFVGASPEAAAAGRLGSWLTVNGGPPPHRVVVAPGARVRLRLANACNARIMRLRFDGVKAHVVAVDGQPTDTFEPVRSQLPFAPGTRYDLIVDMPEDVGATAMRHRA